MLPKFVKIECIKKENINFFYKNPPEDRYIIVDTSTGEILSDAKGFGYKSEESANKG